MFKSSVLHEIFTPSFDYIDNLAEKFIELQTRLNDGNYVKTQKQLNHCFNEKHYSKIGDKGIRQFVGLDYTPLKDGQEKKQRKSWFEVEFRSTRPFDPAQMNFMILNSPLLR